MNPKIDPNDLPNPDELNPDNPVVKGFRNEWHKLCAIVMWKFRVSKVQISVEDIQRFMEDQRYGHNIVLDNRGDDPRRPLILRLVNDEEAMKYAREGGGMPS